MNINDLFKPAPENAGNKDFSTDKTNLLKVILPVEFDYSPVTQIVTINSAAKVNYGGYSLNTEKDRLEVYFTYKQKDETKTLTKFFSNPFKEGVKPSAVLAVSLQLKEIAESFLGTKIYLDQETFPVNNLSELASGLLSRINNTANTAYLLVEFKSEESTSVYIEISNVRKFIANKESDLDVSSLAKRTMKIILPEAVQNESEKEELSLADLLGN